LLEGGVICPSNQKIESFQRKLGGKNMVPSRSRVRDSSSKPLNLPRGQEV